MHFGYYLQKVRLKI